MVYEEKMGFGPPLRRKIPRRASLKSHNKLLGPFFCCWQVERWKIFFLCELIWKWAVPEQRSMVQGANAEMGRRPDLHMWLHGHQGAIYFMNIKCHCCGHQSGLPLIWRNRSFWWFFHLTLPQISSVARWIAPSKCLLFSSECKGSPQGLSQVKCGHKKLTETNPTPDVSVVLRLLLSDSSFSLQLSFSRYIWFSNSVKIQFLHYPWGKYSYIAITTQ